MIDELDIGLLDQLLVDATQSYAVLGQAVGLSTASAHERIRKLRQRGVIRRTTVEVDPPAVNRGLLAFVLLDADAWMGGHDTREALSAIPEILEAHVIAGDASLLLKVRVASQTELQDVLSEIFTLPGVTRTRSSIVLETFFERPLRLRAQTSPRKHAGPSRSARLPRPASRKSTPRSK
jgi:Lrp/AsnC family leucine-responsive transcriptional regulator